MTVQRPYQPAQAALNTYEDQPIGRRLARSWRANPLGRWTRGYQHLTDAEFATLKALMQMQRKALEDLYRLGEAGKVFWLR